MARLSSVRKTLRVKGNSVFTVGLGATVWDAHRLMSENGVSSVLVTEVDRLGGTFAGCDDARRMGLPEPLPSAAGRRRNDGRFDRSASRAIGQ